MEKHHENGILRCLQLAKSGIGTSRPNPSVGAVIVYNNKIIGEGFTSPYGKEHAEVNAINSVKNKELLKQATLYVTLEPCSHYGKTPPCSDLIVEKKIPNVVIGCIDTNSLVAGKGIERLKKGGCNVIAGVLEKECLEHHKRFFTVHNKKRPYIILKWAKTQDGFIAPLTKNEQKPVWISNRYSQQLVHKWRSEEHAILVGTNTVIADNPKLNVRSWSGNNPIRVVLDINSRILKNVNVFDNSVKTIVITGTASTTEVIGKNIYYEHITMEQKGSLAKQICEVLQKHSIQSLIIEGGAQTLQTFIDENLWDEARVFTGNSYFKKGIKEPNFSGKLITTQQIKNDVLKLYKNQAD